MKRLKSITSDTKMDGYIQQMISDMQTVEGMLSIMHDDLAVNYPSMQEKTNVIGNTTYSPQDLFTVLGEDLTNFRNIHDIISDIKAHSGVYSEYVKQAKELGIELM